MDAWITIQFVFPVITRQISSLKSTLGEGEDALRERIAAV